MALDFARHDFNARELRVLVLLAVKGRGEKITRDHHWFEERLGLRSDKVLETLRELERSRVLKPGWEVSGEFVIEPNVDLWKRRELARREPLCQGTLDLTSSDERVRFEQSLAAENLERDRVARRELNRRDGAAGERGREVSSPQVGEDGRLSPNLAAGGSPQFGGGRVDMRCECPTPKTFPPNVGDGLREALIARGVCYVCAVRLRLVRTVRNNEDSTGRTTTTTAGPEGSLAALEELLRTSAEWVERLAKDPMVMAVTLTEARAQLARGYQPKLLGGWLRSVFRKHLNLARKI